MPRTLDVFELYEAAVQSPEIHVDLFKKLYSETRGGHMPRVLREDFCGTFAVSCAWVRDSDTHRAMGVDLDPVPLASGRKRHLARLTPAEKRRIDIRRGNVLTVRGPKADVVVACNYSFYIFKRRAELRRYFEAARRALAQDGVLVLEMSGGPGMIEEIRERKQVRRKGLPAFQYTWDQKSFDPISNDARFSIHFRLKDGREFRDAFRYDWRLWTIPEVLELLEEAGFARSVVYWEEERDGVGTGEYMPAQKGTNDFCWCAYIVGVK